jgi:hypothetical protein
MSIQGNLIKLKKAASKNKKVYLVYGDRKKVEGKIDSIGNLFVHILSIEHDDIIMVEIEKIEEISLQTKWVAV